MRFITWMLIWFFFDLLPAFHINFSSSMPRGVYIITSDAIRKGDLVAACLPTSMATLAIQRAYVPQGICPTQHAPLFKKIVAVQHDDVVITSQGILVNGQLLPHSKAYEYDSHQHRLPHLKAKHFHLGPNQFWLYGTGHAHSFDSRYFGVISQQYLLYRVKPLWQKS
jgi:conjugative transfer signal peptidase TraF